VISWRGAPSIGRSRPRLILIRPSIGDLVRFVVQDKDRDIADLVNYIHGQQIEV
jgi:hypothetical protein